MDSKKFLQIVEEKKQKALEKKLARLEWEGRLEDAARAQRRDKRTQKKHKRKVLSDSSVDPDTSRKCGLPRQNKRYSSSAASEPEGFRRESRADRRSHGRHRRRDLSSESSGSDSYAVRHRSRKRYRRKHKCSSHDLSDHSLDSKTGKRRNRRRYKRKGSDSDDSSSSDEERELQRRHKQTETDSEDSEKSGGKRKHHGHKHKKHGKRSRGGDHRGHASFQEEDKAGLGDGEHVHKDVEHRDSKERWDFDRYRSSDVEEQIERLRSEHRLSPHNEPVETIQKDSGHGQNTSVTNGKLSSAI